MSAGFFQVPEGAGGTYDFWVWCQVPESGSPEHRIYVVEKNRPQGQGREQVCPGEGTTNYTENAKVGKKFFCQVQGVELKTGEISLWCKYLAVFSFCTGNYFE